MNFIIELDGPVFDVEAGWHKAHEDAVGTVGWSRLDRASFWAQMRSKGSDGDFLRGARPIKLKEYQSRFAERTEAADIISLFVPRANVGATLGELTRFGGISFFTTGTNVASRQHLLKKHGLDRFGAEVFSLNPDPRRRPAELRILAANDRRAIVAACSDNVIRVADSAELFTVGISGGPCSAPRLHRAGPRIVYPDLNALPDALQNGAADLIHAGLLPTPLG